MTMSDKKIKEVKPTVLGRRKVSIPHYAAGGVSSGVVYGGGGLFGDVGSGIQNFSGDLTAQNQYQAQLAPTTQSDYSGIVGQAGQNALAGYGGFNANQGQQQQLASALGNVANGSGPNPAQAMLSNATGANVANQAALIAGQRGAGANVGLQARQAAMAGSNVQQQAAGQAAALQSQQQLNALNSQGQVLGQMGSQNIAEQGANNSLFGSAAGAQNTQNSNTITNYNDAQNLNQKTSQSNADSVNKTTGGFLNGAGGAITGLLGLAKGGQVPSHMQKVFSIYHADGGMIPAPTATGTSTATSTATATAPALSPEQRKSKELKLKDVMDPDTTAFVGYANGGDVVPDSPRDFTRVAKYLIGPKDQAAIDNVRVQEGPVSGDDLGEDPNKWKQQRIAQDPKTTAPEGQLPSAVKPQMQLPSNVIGATDFRSGGAVGGTAKVVGNSLKNDIEPAMLSPKEIVLPRSITMAPDAPEKAKAFVEALLKKQGHGNSTHHKEFHKALKAAILSRKTKSGA